MFEIESQVSGLIAEHRVAVGSKDKPESSKGTGKWWKSLETVKSLLEVRINLKIKDHSFHLLIRCEQLIRKKTPNPIYYSKCFYYTSSSSI